VSLLAVVATSCKKKHENVPLNPAQVHTITREMQRSAWRILRKPDALESHLDFDGVNPGRPDHLRIEVSARETEQTQNKLLSDVVQALDRVGTSHELTRDPEARSQTSVRLSYRRAGVLTHAVEIATLPAMERSVFPKQTGAARLAIILDDLGNDRGVAEAIFALKYPLTISVLPNHAHSSEIAEEAHSRGYEVMLHLPMQSVANEKPEPQELRPGMSAGNVTELVDRLLRSVPDVVGVNNHQGSESTADTTLMHDLMPVLREHHLFYVDSRTTAATVAFDAAQGDGVRSGFRNVPFLDDVADESAVEKQLQIALRGAKQKGEAIAIGHPHAATLRALRKVLPKAGSQGVALVFASEVVH
jgi:uncharacterized protein